MPDREFEKSIQRKANELRLKPSPEVWERVASQLDEKDRRKGFAWIWLAAAMIAGGLALWFINPTFFNESAKPSISQTTGTSSRNNENANESNSTLSETPSLRPSANPNANSTSANELDATQAATIDALIGQAEKPNHKRTGKTETPASLNVQGYAGTRPSARSQSNLSSAEASASTIQVTGLEVIPSQNNQELILTGKMPRLSNALPSRGIITPYDKLQGDTRLSNDLLAVNEVPIKKSQGWDLAMQVGGGSGSLRDGLSHPYNMRYETMAGGISLMPSGPGTNAALDPKPSSVRSGPSFQANVGLSRALGKRTSFNTGLQYAYMSSRIEVGNKIDPSAMNSNFRLLNISASTAYTGVGNNGKAYYNAYHYLQIPLEIGWALDPKKKLSWNNGVVFGYLISTDALHYDQSAGAYYQNNDLVNKFQTGIQTSLNYNLLSTGTGALAIGPFFNYQLKNIDKTADGKRLMTVGLNARFIFGKPKQ